MGLVIKILAIMYSVFSFVIWDGDVTRWSVMTRFLYVFLSLLVWTFFVYQKYMMYIHQDDEEQTN